MESENTLMKSDVIFDPTFRRDPKNADYAKILRAFGDEASGMKKEFNEKFEEYQKPVKKLYSFRNCKKRTKSFDKENYRKIGPTMDPSVLKESLNKFGLSEKDANLKGIMDEANYGQNSGQLNQRSVLKHKRKVLAGELAKSHVEKGNSYGIRAKKILDSLKGKGMSVESIDKALMEHGEGYHPRSGEKQAAVENYFSETLNKMGEIAYQHSSETPTYNEELAKVGMDVLEFAGWGTAGCTIGQLYASFGGDWTPEGQGLMNAFWAADLAAYALGAGILKLCGKREKRAMERLGFQKGLYQEPSQEPKSSVANFVEAVYRGR